MGARHFQLSGGPPMGASRRSVPAGTCVCCAERWAPWAGHIHRPCPHPTGLACPAFVEGSSGPSHLWDLRQQEGSGVLAGSPSNLWKRALCWCPTHCPVVTLHPRGCQTCCKPMGLVSRMKVQCWACSPTALTLHPPSTDSHVETTYHDRLVAHVELGLSRDQGLLVLLNDWGDPA